MLIDMIVGELTEIRRIQVINTYGANSLMNLTKRMLNTLMLFGILTIFSSNNSRELDHEFDKMY